MKLTGKKKKKLVQAIYTVEKKRVKVRGCFFCKKYKKSKFIE